MQLPNLTKVQLTHIGLKDSVTMTPEIILQDREDGGIFVQCSKPALPPLHLLSSCLLDLTFDTRPSIFGAIEHMEILGVRGGNWNFVFGAL